MTLNRTIRGLRAALLAAATLAGACAEDSGQVIEGHVAQANFEAQVLGVRAVRGAEQVAWTEVSSEGSFVLEVPLGSDTRLEVVTAEGAHGLVTRDGERVENLEFDVCGTGDPFDLGHVHDWDGSDQNGGQDGEHDCSEDPCLEDPDLCMDPCANDPGCGMTCDQEGTCCYEDGTCCKPDGSCCYPDGTCDVRCDAMDPDGDCYCNEMDPASDCYCNEADPASYCYCNEADPASYCYCDQDDPSSWCNCAPDDPNSACYCNKDDPDSMCYGGERPCDANTGEVCCDGGTMDDPGCWPEPEPPPCKDDQDAMAGDMCWTDGAVAENDVPDFGCN